MVADGCMRMQEIARNWAFLKKNIEKAQIGAVKLQKIAGDWAFLKKNIEKAQIGALKLHEIAEDCERLGFFEEKH